jgi:hypothetical protein
MLQQTNERSKWSTLLWNYYVIINMISVIIISYWLIFSKFKKFLELKML